jgi:hypothetical protein
VTAAAAAAVTAPVCAVPAGTLDADSGCEHHVTVLFTLAVCLSVLLVIGYKRLDMFAAAWSTDFTVCHSQAPNNGCKM